MGCGWECCNPEGVFMDWVRMGVLYACGNVYGLGADGSAVCLWECLWIGCGQECCMPEGVFMDWVWMGVLYA